MVFDGVTVVVLLIILASTPVRAVFGFGNALIAMPLLAMTPIGMKTASPLIALIATVLSLVILVQEWRMISHPETAPGRSGRSPDVRKNLLDKQGNPL